MAFTVATAATPGARPSSSTASRVTAAVTRNGPASISTSAMTPSLSTEATTPAKRLRAESREPGDAVLPHVLMRQLELRYDRAAAGAAGFSARFELALTDPEQLWSVEPAADAPGRFALVARPDGLQARAGACLDADAVLTCSVETCTRLVARDPGSRVEIEVAGAEDLAATLLDLLGARAPAGRAVAA